MVNIKIEIQTMRANTRRYKTPSNLLRLPGGGGGPPERENLFQKLPGFTFGSSTRMDTKAWDFNQVK